ncbi:MAG: hypothetical protein H6867_09470 [Rhodospirillales bacterium]|nr:hypothetical protein [Rhodospirillales bacterium]
MTEAVDLMAAAEAASEPEAGDVTPVIELPAAPEPPAEPESFQLAQADISEVSDATPPVMTPAEKTPEPAPAKAADLMPSPQATQTQQAAKPAENGTANAIQGSTASGGCLFRWGYPDRADG